MNNKNCVIPNRNQKTGEWIVFGCAVHNEKTGFDFLLLCARPPRLWIFIYR